MVRERLSLEQFTAKFHDSAIAADGVLAFALGPTPYDLNLNCERGAAGPGAVPARIAAWR